MIWHKGLTYNGLKIDDKDVIQQYIRCTSYYQTQTKPKPNFSCCYKVNLTWGQRILLHVNRIDTDKFFKLHSVKSNKAVISEVNIKYYSLR